MAKVGYIFLAEGYDTYEADIQWMKEYGCVRIIEEKTANERLRPDWRQLLMTLERGDVLVLSKFSNALRSRSSIFRIFNKHGITLNRGPHSGPIKKRSERKNPIIKEDKQ